MPIIIWCVVLCLAISLPAIHSDDVTCGEPPFIDFAHTTTEPSEEYAVEATISYACDFGYVIDGTSRTSQCVLSQDGGRADWTNPQMSCIPRSCGDPGFVPNSHRVGSLFAFPNFVIYECDEGYQLRGNARRYCQASGSWSGRLPRCESISCFPPENPEYGRVIYTSLDYGSELNYECDQGYHVKDEEPIFCTSEGTWSRTDAVCVEVSCNIPVAPDQGSVEFIGPEDSLRAGAIAVFACKGGLIPDGPTTSKCLDIGQWTFPAPKCLEPCSIPQVLYGRIGRYVKERFVRNLIFREITVGSRLEDGEKMFLHCNSGYSPLGSANWQEMVTCREGKWSDNPYCEPSMCRKDPPWTDNARVDAVDMKHGGSVLYMCLADFQKVKSGNVTCNFGEWKGITPICKDTRCYMDQIEFPGLQKGPKKSYKNGETFEIACDRRYQKSRENAQMRCEEGSWKGPMPPCLAASCSSSPPSINFGKAEVASVTHSSVVKYTCENQYVLEGSNQVQCLFGEWSGKAPTCKEGRCYLKYLKNDLGVSPVAESATSSGNRLNVLCKEGYSPNDVLPKCVNGEWTQNSSPPCKENDCSVQWIPNGNIKEQILGPSTWNWFKFRYERPLTYQNVMELVPLGSIPRRSAVLILFCHRGYTFQDSSRAESQIFCSEGKWSPDPVCLLPGTKYVATTMRSLIVGIYEMKRIDSTKSTTRTTTPSSALRISQSTTERPTTSNLTVAPISVDESEPNVKESTNTENEVSTEKDVCYCEYTIYDDNIVAHTDGKQLHFYDRVENGIVVQFRCKEVGFHHLIGPKNITCENCRSWHSSEFPSCIDPKQGDAVILYDNNVNISMDGVLEVGRGQTVRLTCVAMEAAEYPKWSMPAEQGISISNEYRERKEDYLYISYLDIENPNTENEGLYTCAVGNFLPTIVELRVIDPDKRCQRFEDDEDLNVTYDTMDARVGSRATFSCRRNGEKMNGMNISTCLRNGQWSVPAPQCIEITCKLLKGTDLMEIAYTNEQKIGSFASFHCFSPGQRSGVSRAQCLENGRWSDPTPTCRTPPCFVDALVSSLPQGIIPDMEDVNNSTMPYNSTIRFACKENSVLSGNPVAKCGKNGDWEMDEVQCVQGCLSITRRPNSRLVMTPDNDAYKFGETVTFSCPPGQSLDIELEKVMCLTRGWSDSFLPECVDIDYEDT